MKNTNNNNNNGKKANGNANTKNTKTMKKDNKTTATENKAKRQNVAVNAKMQEYANKRQNRLAEKHNNALQYATNKQTTANVINNVATYNRFMSVDVDLLCNVYIDFVRQLKKELPKDLVGLLKKYGCDTIRNQVTTENITAFIDVKGNVNAQSLVRLVCKFNKDIANIIRNIRKAEKAEKAEK